MSTSVICILLTIGVYLIGMLVVGFRFAKRMESAADFYLGGESWGRW